MPRLIVRIIGTKEGSGIESILATVGSEQYDPDHVDASVNAALDGALQTLQGDNVSVLRSWCPEVSVVLSSDDERIRPSLHLTPGTLHKLSDAGASFDFDPYV